MTNPMRDMPRRSPTGQDQKAAQGCLVLLISPILLLPLSVYEGWVMMVMWGWFVAPTFNLPYLGLWSASGIALLVGWLNSTYRPADAPAMEKDPFGVYSKQVLFILLMGAVTLLVGRFLHAFMG